VIVGAAGAVPGEAGRITLAPADAGLREAALIISKDNNVT